MVPSPLLAGDCRVKPGINKNKQKFMAGKCGIGREREIGGVEKEDRGGGERVVVREREREREKESRGVKIQGGWWCLGGRTFEGGGVARHVVCVPPCAPLL